MPDPIASTPPAAVASANPAPPSPPASQPLTPGDRVTLAAGWPNVAPGDRQPVGRIVAVVPVVKIAGANPDGTAITAPDGVQFDVSWPSLMTNSRHRPADLKRHERKAKS